MSRLRSLSHQSLRRLQTERAQNPQFIGELEKVGRGERSALQVANRLRVSVDEVQRVSSTPEGPSAALGKVGAGGTLRAYGFFEVLGEAQKVAHDAMKPGLLEETLGALARVMLPASMTSRVDADELKGIDALLREQSLEGEVTILAAVMPTLREAGDLSFDAHQKLEGYEAKLASLSGPLAKLRDEVTSGATLARDIVANKKHTFDGHSETTQLTAWALLFDDWARPRVEFSALRRARVLENFGTHHNLEEARDLVEAFAKTKLEISPDGLGRQEVKKILSFTERVSEEAGSDLRGAVHRLLDNPENFRSAEAMLSSLKLLDLDDQAIVERFESMPLADGVQLYALLELGAIGESETSLWPAYADALIAQGEPLSPIVVEEMLRAQAIDPLLAAEHLDVRPKHRANRYSSLGMMRLGPSRDGFFARLSERFAKDGDANDLGRMMMLHADFTVDVKDIARHFDAAQLHSHERVPSSVFNRFREEARRLPDDRGLAAALDALRPPSGS